MLTPPHPAGADPGAVSMRTASSRDGGSLRSQRMSAKGGGGERGREDKKKFSIKRCKSPFYKPLKIIIKKKTHPPVKSE